VCVWCGVCVWGVCVVCGVWCVCVCGVCVVCVCVCVVCVCVISGFVSEVAVSCALLGHYEGSSSDLSPTFRDNLSVPSSRARNPNRNHVTSSHGFIIVYPFQSR
jgi:hypothetical protein